MKTTLKILFLNFNKIVSRVPPSPFSGREWKGGVILKLFRFLLTITILLLNINTVLAQKKPTHPSKKTAQKAIKTQSLPAKTDSLDKETGLINDENLMFVKAHCTGCHSSKTILQHRFTRDEWKAKIKWMQQYHKLWDLGETEKNVLDYLEKYYSAAIQKASLSRQKALKEFIWYQLEK